MAHANLPPEVAAYFASGRRKVVSVTANNDFTLTITFDNGEVRLYDMHDELQGDVFRPLRQLDAFQRVYIDDCGSIAWDLDPNVDNEIVWNNKVDLCPDSCYIYSKPLKKADAQAL